MPRAPGCATRLAPLPECAQTVERLSAAVTVIGQHLIEPQAVAAAELALQRTSGSAASQQPAHPSGPAGVPAGPLAAGAGGSA
jgi:hypothetical protein